MQSKAKNLLRVEYLAMEISQTGILEVILEGKSESISVESDDQIEKIVKALSSRTRRKILQYINEEPLDVSNIASILNMTEANISAQIKKLEAAGLINCTYSSGDHGVRKISSPKFHRLVIKF
ncbi:MAG: helix-turn-helix transcriptional regulator [Candidatus Lokiarchaeota archaeon]|nr:helix-turn-helix transcriptional regulator [Candidatus Lokiarchaeota archaeon]